MDTRYRVCAWSYSWKKPRKLRVLSVHESKHQAEASLRIRRMTTNTLYGAAAEAVADYFVMGPRQYAKQMAVEEADVAVRRAEGQLKSQASRKRNKTEPHFVLCPTCKARSKKLYSEMGGLETRVCRRGHRFKYDRWPRDHALYYLFA
jgi:hypothetical protein